MAELPRNLSTAAPRERCTRRLSSVKVVRQGSKRLRLTGLAKRLLTDSTSPSMGALHLAGVRLHFAPMSSTTVCLVGAESQTLETRLEATTLSLEVTQKQARCGGPFTLATRGHLGKSLWRTSGRHASGSTPAYRSTQKGSCEPSKMAFK